ncbi:MAG: DJ-1/PfpI family protein [Treponema sp.]|nr:DJ-1/PfpI family protein [Treponema sp.]
MKKVAVLLARGFEEIEALTVVDYLRRAEVDVTMVAIPDRGSVESSALVVGSHAIPVVADIQLNAYLYSLKNNLPDAVYIPGGMPGAANIAFCESAVNFITDCAVADKLVAAICAAPVVVLAKTGLLAGRKYTCYPGMEEGLPQYCGDDNKMKICMKDSTLIRNVPWVYDDSVLTGRGPGAAEEFAMEFVRLLVGEAIADRVKLTSCQR